MSPAVISGCKVFVSKSEVKFPLPDTVYTFTGPDALRLYDMLCERELGPSDLGGTKRSFSVVRSMMIGLDPDLGIAPTPQQRSLFNRSLAEQFEAACAAAGRAAHDRKNP